MDIIDIVAADVSSGVFSAHLYQFGRQPYRNHPKNEVALYAFAFLFRWRRIIAHLLQDILLTHDNLNLFLPIPIAAIDVGYLCHW